MNIEKKLQIALINNDIKALRKIERKILKTKNLRLSIKFCRESFVVDLEKHQKMILDSKDLHANYEFAKYISGINIKGHEQIILDNNSPIYSYKFALNVKGADIKKHAKVVIESRSLEYNYQFALNIKGADIDDHGKIILESKDENYCYIFIRDIKVKDIKEYEDVVLESKTILTNYQFALNIKGADIRAHGEVILDKNEEYFVNNYLPKVDNAKEIFSDYIEDQKKKTRTLAIIKPDGMENIEKIISMIYDSGLKIVEYSIKTLDEEILKEHYSHLIDKPFFPDIVKYMSSAPVAIMVLEGENAVSKFRTLMGPTDSTLADKGTIRGEFGTDKSTNAVHGSDSKENAEIEINRFFKEKVKTK